ncbi:MAG: 23S rRNA (cytidine(2498)-2'-O)-methyltransferase RlmM [Magnetococcales bacterium]|nr:23S rRNA (cytidine(2498)-2'-O)-methyltransferase RlmM [Magnetococcales bacterium]
MNSCTQMLVLCRPGFEPETAREYTAHAAQLGVAGQSRFQERTGWALFIPEKSEQIEHLVQHLSVQRLIFARHVLAVDDGTPSLPPGDRLVPLQQRLDVLASQVGSFSVLWLSHSDSESGRALAPLCRALQGRLDQYLADKGLLNQEAQGVRAEVVWISGSAAWVGYSHPASGARWPMGIPRVRRPVGSPSRAALKLEEAWMIMLTPSARQQLLAPGRTAVDLGAAPGGWSRMLLQDGLSVVAVDRADLALELRNSPRLHHVRVDGFRFRPERCVDWLLCDMVEQPRRIASLVSHWALSGWCHNALFNLKLPMKKRYTELEICRNLLQQPLVDAKRFFHLTIRHLYHDREEVTGLLQLFDHPGKRNGKPR